MSTPKPQITNRSGTINARVTEEIAEKLTLLANDNNLSKTDIVAASILLLASNPGLLDQISFEGNCPQLKTTV